MVNNSETLQDINSFSHIRFQLVNRYSYLPKTFIESEPQDIKLVVIK